LAFFYFKKKQGQNIIYYYSQKNGPTFGKILWLYFGQNFLNVMIAQKIFRWWAQMAEDNLFHDILIIGTSSWDYEDNFDPISRKKILISRKNLHFLCLLYFSSVKSNFFFNILSRNVLFWMTVWNWSCCCFSILFYVLKKKINYFFFRWMVG